MKRGMPSLDNITWERLERENSVTYPCDALDKPGNDIVFGDGFPTKSGRAKLVPVGPPNRYEEVAGHPNVTLWACRPCVEARGLTAAGLDRRVKLGGMNEFHAAAREPDTRIISF